MKSPSPQTPESVGGSAEPVPDAAALRSNAGTGEGDLRRALGINAALLELVAAVFKVDQDEKATIEHNGTIIARCSINEALDIANAALEPKPQQENSVTAQPETTDAPPS